MPGNDSNSSRQNLYITNNLEKSIDFVFVYDGTYLSVSVVTTNSFPELLSV